MFRVIAVAVGLTAANIYYAQPLLPAIARDYGVRGGTAALIVTVSQLGYAVGLAFLVPLGDLVDRRRLIPTVLLITSLALAGAAVAPNVAVLIGLAALIGAGSVVSHVMVPLAAQLSSDAQRGRVVGTVMSGLLIGVLLARTAAGAIADVAGSWRAVYGFAAVLIATLSVILRRELPADAPRPAVRYRALLRSVVHIFATQPVLRLRSLFGFLSFAAFATFWTSIAFLLAAPPYRYSNTVIGLFGLIGAAGAACASVAGRLADSGHTRAATGAFTAAIAASFAILGVGRHSVVALIAGVIVLDVGCQGVHVLNQHTNYSLLSEAPSRLNAAYMTVFFLGGASGSAASAVAYTHGGWNGVCLLGTGLGLASTALWLATMRGAKENA